METFVWRRDPDPNYIKSGVAGWRCIGGAPKSRYDQDAKEWINMPPTRSKYGYYNELGELVAGECGKMSVFVRKGDGQGSDSWEPAEECFIETEKTSNLYTPEGRTRSRHLSVSMFSDLKAGLQLGDYFVDYDDFDFLKGPTSTMTLYSGEGWTPLLKHISPSTIAADKSFKYYNPGVANETWNTNYKFTTPEGVVGTGSVVRSSYFQDWLQGKYSDMGRDPFDEWAMKLAYGDPSNGQWGGTKLNSARTAAVPFGNGWPYYERPNVWGRRIDLVDLGNSNSWTGSWNNDAEMFTRNLKASGLGSFGTGRSVQEPWSANYPTRTGNNYELTWHYQGPGPVSLADKFDGNYLQWPKAEDYSGDRGQFWNCLAEMLIPAWFNDMFSSEIEPDVSVPYNGYVLEVVDDSLPHSDVGITGVGGEWSDIKTAGEFIVYRESYLDGSGPLQDVANGKTTWAGWRSDLVKRGLGQADQRQDVFNVTPWTNRIPAAASQIDPFFVRWYGTPDSVEQTLP